MKTALVEREHLGGICLNWGCIPTKALLRSSEIYHLLHRLDDFGFSAKDIQFDAGKVVARSRAVAKQLSNGVAYLLRKNKVTVVDGHGRLAGKGRLAVAKDGNPVAELTRAAYRAGHRRAGAQPAGAGGPTASGSGPTRKRWCRRRSPNRCWSSARARSGSNSPASTVTWAPRSRWSKCSTACSRSRTRRSPPLPANPSRSRGLRSIPGRQ